jgi:ubiquinone biosynthesis protein
MMLSDALFVARIAGSAANLTARLAVERVSRKGRAGNARWAAEEAQRLGPSVVKFAQFMSTRSDVLPAEYAAAFSRLCAEATPDPPRVARTTVSAALGVASPEEVFDSFDSEPFAAASVAQVHRALLRRSDGRSVEVAIKIRRADVRRQVERDLRITAWLSTVLRPWLDQSSARQLSDLSDRYSADLTRQLDLRREAASSERARKRLQRAMSRAVRVPRVVKRLSGTDIIVMEFVPSEPVFSAPDPPATARVLMHALLAQLLLNGEFHCDMHSGNVGVDPGTGALVIYDYGNTGVLSNASRQAGFEIGVAVGSRDEAALARILLDRGIVRLTRPLEGSDALLTLVRQLFMYLDTMDVRNFTLAPDMDGVLLAPDTAAAFRAIVMTEGICMQLDPAFNTRRCIDAFVIDHINDILMERARIDISRL